ncbi:MAG TPA: CBS domain-containing protein [Candidatus Binatia bacterium]|nr:CBS domain-containing protein [Candidatus Binatia bacterium]
MPGKADWLAYGLPVETESGELRLVVNFLQRKIPYCRLTETVGEALERVPKPGPVFCPVLNNEEIVLGVLTDEAKKTEPARPVEEVMELGPTTIRPSADVEETLQYFSRNNKERVLVTSSDGKFLGLFARDEKVTRPHG